MFTMSILRIFKIKIKNNKYSLEIINLYIQITYQNTLS